MNMPQVLSKEFLDIQAIAERLEIHSKRVFDMIKPQNIEQKPI